MTTLIIDTTDQTKTTVKLENSEVKDQITEVNTPKSQTALLLIDKILKKNKMNPVDIDEIKVNTGPGSFTGTRVGISIANALGFSLDISVNGSRTKPTMPKYR